MIYSLKQFEELKGDVCAYDLWVAKDSRAILWEELCQSKYLTKETKSEIIKLIEETNDWIEIKKKHNINGIKCFLQKYPNSRFRKQAVALSINILKKEKDNKNSSQEECHYGCMREAIPFQKVHSKFLKKETYVPCNTKQKESLDTCPQQLYTTYKYKETGIISKLKRFLFGEKSKKTNYLHNRINASVFAPSETRLDDYMIVQVFLYNDGEGKAVKRKASIVDKDAVQKNYTPLSVKLKQGDKISISLKMVGNCTKVWNEKQELVWQGYMSDCQFAVHVTKNFVAQTLVGTVLLSVNDLPVGQNDVQN